MNKELRNRSIPPKFLRTLAFCVWCVALNVVGAVLASTLKLPIYFDSMGTILISIIGGYVPGIAVGYATNLMKTIFVSGSIYYGLVNVIIAIITVRLARRGWFKKLSRTIFASILLTAVCGTLDLLLSHYLGEGSVGSQLAAPLAQQLYSAGILDYLPAQIAAEYAVNFVDKVLVVLLATLIYHMLPATFVASLDFAPWRQTPLSPRELNAAMDTKPRRLSLATKVVILVASIVTIAAIAATVFSYVSFHQSTIELESNKAKGITALMSEVIDPNKVPEYLARGEAAEGYKETEEKLAEIRDSFDNVQYVYVYQIRSDGCHVVFDPDTPDTPGSNPGEVIDFDESFQSSLPTLLAGQEIDPIISNETYGWLLTIYTPLKNDAGETVCYLAADLSMERLIQNEYSFVVGVIILFASFFILICAIIIWLANYSVIIPINSIAHAADNFVLDETGIRQENLEPIERLNIHTGDEIENLYDVVGEMSKEVVSHVAEAQEKSDAIARMQSNLIMVLADLVESRDKFTGDHVRNTATYARIIMNQMRREGIHPEILTNEFISNVYQSAPLHDVGKIAVSDAILNKPGRLTDEEFEIMKNHTLAGQEILENAKSAVSESSYLDEAQRLAAYHHEKWDGSGYPYGLAGEEIPLSARIMAVADVFDALVSKRSYKAGFPLEKAFAIIEEGIGTHFDPDVARAFLHAKDKASAVAEEAKLKAAQEPEPAQESEATKQEATEDKPEPPKTN